MRESLGEKSHDTQGRVPFRFRQPERLLRAQAHPAGSSSARAPSSPTCRSCSAACSSSPTTSRPWSQFKGVKNKQEYQRLEIMRFIKRHGLTQFKMNPHFPVNTVQIMRGAVAAEMDGQIRAHTSTRSFITCGRRERRWTTPTSSAPRSTAPASTARACWRASGTRRSRTSCSRTRKRSVARGTFGAPTFFVGDEIFFGKDRLRDVEEEIVAAKAK